MKLLDMASKTMVQIGSIFEKKNERLRVSLNAQPPNALVPFQSHALNDAWQLRLHDRTRIQISCKGGNTLALIIPNKAARRCPIIMGVDRAIRVRVNHPSSTGRHPII
ncbi:hypothetical protein LINPERPRIM_LOCUS21668 [Linum perenne]